MAERFTGYVSPEAKRRFTTAVGVLGALFFLAQFLLPMVIGVVMMSVLMFSQMTRLEFARFESLVRWRGDVYWATSRLAGPPVLPVDEPNGAFVRLTQEGPVPMEGLPNDTRWLLADGELLWVFADEGVFRYGGQTLTRMSEPAPPDSDMRPFLLNGQPAVVHEMPGRRMVKTIEAGAWREIAQIHIDDTETEPLLPDRLKVVEAGGKPFVLYKRGQAVFCHEGFPGPSVRFPEDWESVTFVRYGWTVAVVDGMPAVFRVDDASEEFSSRILGSRREPDGWRDFFTMREGFPPMGVGVVGHGRGDAFTLLVQVTPWATRVCRAEGGKVISTERLGQAFPFFGKGMMLWMIVPHLGMMLCPVVLAIILSALMRRHRVCTYADVESPVAYASLVRRALAQLIDSLILGAPTIAAIVPVFSIFSKLFEEGPKPGMIVFPMLLMVGGLCWLVVALGAFGIAEGVWGLTPGKWLLGIRVLGADLKPCGIGRGLLRNLLKFADGFFNFLVGILLVALTENWQRLGDMAARTIVVRETKT